MTAPLRVLPSILSADFARLGSEVEAVARAGADGIHVDVMDGHFVPNITIGPAVCEALSRATRLLLDVHVMIDEPERYAEAFIRAGAGIYTFHVEASPDPRALARRVRAAGRKAGLAVSPDTPVERVLPFLGEIDLLLVMTVRPGFGGQGFMAGMVEKVRRVRAEGPAGLDVEVDGGINPETGAECVRAGANLLVAGTSIFRAKEYAEAIAAIRRAAEAGGAR